MEIGDVSSLTCGFVLQVDWIWKSLVSTKLLCPTGVIRTVAYVVKKRGRPRVGGYDGTRRTGDQIPLLVALNADHFSWLIVKGTLWGN